MGNNSYEKPDFWSQKAFSEGYPARSVYKLKEIDEKFGMIKKNYTVLDLGSAPGSWTTFLYHSKLFVNFFQFIYGTSRIPF